MARPLIFPDASRTVGETPLVELGRIGKGLGARVLAKLEMRNPCASVKDRLGVALIESAERSGLLAPGMTLVEATGGNTGIGLAHAGDAVARARQLLAEIPGAVMLDQFNNPANPEVHRKTTAVEIWRDTAGCVDAFVCAVGTGGTITGVGEFLKQRKPDVRIVAVEPSGAAVLSGGTPGKHQMPGIGVGFIPGVLNRSIIDEISVVTDEQAFDAARRLARQEGIVAGVSSGAALHAAIALATRSDARGKTLVVLLPDTGERYLDSPLFEKG